jgi:hypothetical protein
MDEPEREVVESLGDYALAEDGTDFIVYARDRPDQILGRFPGDDDGFTRAEELYRSLLAPYRRQRYVKGFLILFFAALGIHVASITIVYLLQASEGSSASFGETGSTLIALIERWASTAGAIANAVWIAGLAGMAGLWLARRVFGKNEPSS